MSIEPICAFCGVGDKNRCKTTEDAENCNTKITLATIKENPKKPEVILDNEFGFSFVEENNMDEVVLDQQETLNDLETRLETLYNAIIPFLDNLCKNPEKKTISWPNRVEKITEYKKKLQLIKEGKL